MRVENAEYVKGYEIRILFSDGKVKVVDFTYFLNDAKGLLRDLLDLEYFQSFKIDDTTLVWPNEMDFCPDMLYEIGKTTRNKSFAPDNSKVVAGIWKGLTENNTDLILESLNEYLNMINKTEFLKDSGISNRTLFHALKTKNPTIKTLCKIVSQIAKKKPGV